jgi:hypothetical protein
MSRLWLIAFSRRFFSMNLVIWLLILRVNICVIVYSQKPWHNFPCDVYVIGGLCSDSHCTEEHSSMHSKTCKRIREVSTEQKLCSWGSITLLVALMKFADGSTWVQGGHLSLVRNKSLEPGMHFNDTEHLSYYFTENTLSFYYKDHYNAAIQRNSLYLFWENLKRFIYFLRQHPHFFFLHVCKDTVSC